MRLPYGCDSSVRAVIAEHYVTLQGVQSKSPPASIALTALKR